MNSKARSRMRGILWVATIYVMIGVTLAGMTMPEQTWVCPAEPPTFGAIDDGGSTGPTVGNFKKSDECQATKSASEYAQGIAVVIFSWPILVVGHLG